MSRAEWVSVTPGPEGLAALHTALSALARHPGDIRTAGGAQEFIIPPYLADLYTAPSAPKRRRSKKEEGDE